MTQLERLMAVFENGDHDVIPCFIDISFWLYVNASFDREHWLTEFDIEVPCDPFQGGSASFDAFVSALLRNGSLVNMYRDLGFGMRQELLCRPYTVKHNRVEIVTKAEKDEDGTIVEEKTQWFVPVGTMKQVRRFSKTSHTWSCQEYAVKDVNDLRVLCFIHEDQEIVPDFDAQAELIEAVSGQGVVSSPPGRSTPFANLMNQWIGVENMSYALADYPAEIERAIEVLSESDDPIYEAIGDAPAPLVIFDDNITGDVVSPRWFEEYYIPYYRKRARQMHAKGKHLYAHVDGRFERILPLFGKSEVDCAQALTPAPVGDVPVEKLRELAGPDVILWGGIPAVYLSPLYPNHILEDAARRCVELYRNDRRFILGVEDQVPPDADITRLRFISALLEA